MKNPSTDTLRAASDALMAGGTFKQVQKDYDLNYSQLWLFHFDRILDPADRIDPTSASFKTDLARARGFVRIEGGTAFKRDWTLPECSWGLLSVRCSKPESFLRKTFAQYTGVDSEGLRMGKGGRWLNDDASFYRGERPDELARVKAGTDFEAGKAGKVEAPTMVATKPAKVRPTKAAAAKARKGKATKAA